MGSMQQTLTTLIRPGWESAEMVIPILHKSLAALLAVLIYVAQWSPPALRIHLYIMCGLTLCLWGCITIFVMEYRKLQAERKAGLAELKDDDDKAAADGDSSSELLQAPAAPEPAAVRDYTD